MNTARKQWMWVELTSRCWEWNPSHPGHWCWPGRRPSADIQRARQLDSFWVSRHSSSCHGTSSSLSDTTRLENKSENQLSTTHRVLSTGANLGFYKGRCPIHLKGADTGGRASKVPRGVGSGEFYAFPAIFIDTVTFKKGHPNQKGGCPNTLDTPWIRPWSSCLWSKESHHAACDLWHNIKWTNPVLLIRNTFMVLTRNTVGQTSDTVLAFEFPHLS